LRRRKLPNILINNKCHGKCEYCFQKGWINDPNLQDMTLTAFTKAINILESLRVPIVGLAGGEPTLHPQFTEFLKILCSKRFSFINVLTNGLFLNNDWIRWYSDSKEKETFILFNVRDPDTYYKNEWNLLNENIKIATEIMPNNVHIGTTLSTDFGKEDEIRNLLRKYGILDQRISLSAPSFDYDNKFVHKNDLTIMGKIVANIIRGNLDEKIMTHVDCPIPPCAFGEDDFNFVRRWGERLRHRCAPPPLDITPDLRIWYCSSLRDTSIWNWKIDDFRNFRNQSEIYLEIERRLIDLGIRMQPLFNDCFSCDKWYMCLGGCLKLKIQNIPINHQLKKEDRKGFIKKYFARISKHD